MRKSIFDIVSENTDMEKDCERILAMATKEKTLITGTYPDYTLFEFVEEHCFREWLHRGHCVDVDDYLEALDFNEWKYDAPYEVDSFLTLIELVYNFWQLSYLKFQDGNLFLQWRGNYCHLKEVMDDVLEQFNHKAYIDDTNQQVLVVEDKGEITAVSEIINPELSFEVIRYNHRALKGEIEVKKSIILQLGAELEPKRKELSSINKQLAENIFFMLNNLNIRHNNRSKKDKNYKEYVAKMRKERLEKWYDELYQMILLAFLLLDNVERTERVNELKTNIVGGVTNG